MLVVWGTAVEERPNPRLYFSASRWKNGPIGLFIHKRVGLSRAATVADVWARFLYEVLPLTGFYRIHTGA